MGIGVGTILLALGAILSWAVTSEVEGVDLDTVGVILMVAGTVAVLWGLLGSTSLPWRDHPERDDVRSRHRA